MSGVGYYTPNPWIEYNEDYVCENCGDYMNELANAVELSAKLPECTPCRLVTIRSGIILGRTGGMIKRLHWPFFMGFGGIVGSGQQYLPWIHIDDMVRLIRHCIENASVSGILNGVSPHQVTNKEFTKVCLSE